jgi:flavin reductase (DIM6/NTAB) family NADH-FMN oxidoreductase RutF
VIVSVSEHPYRVVDASLQESFRDAMGNVAAAVSVVTTLVDDVPHGTTVSAFASLSMDPPMLLVSLMQGSRLLSVLRPGAAVGINVLGAHQGDVAQRFAERRDDKFDGMAWELADGAPALQHQHAWVAMRVARLVPAGDHTLVLGDVVNAVSDAGTPLTYHRRSFGTHLAH